MKHALIACAIALTLPACVTLQRHRYEMKLQQLEADNRYNQTLAQVGVVVGNLRERLVRLGQIDKDGNLVPLTAAKKASPPAAPPAPAAVPPPAK